MTPALPLRQLGRTGLRVTPLCLGGGPLGGMPETFGYDCPPDRAVATVRRTLDSPIRFLDTAAMYGDGESERRFASAIREHGGLPDDVVLATKVDRDPVTGDFSADQVRRSAEQSLERLGMDRVPLLHLHDPEHISFDEAMAPGGAVEGILALRDEGIAAHIGVAGGPVGLLQRFLRTGLFEVLITHNRWTLIDRSADELIDEAVSLGVGVINGAVFGGGILAKGRDAARGYAYGARGEDVSQRVDAMKDACERYRLPLAAAALQWSTRDPRIDSTIVGLTRPERVDQTVALLGEQVPETLWNELSALASPRADWLW